MKRALVLGGGGMFGAFQAGVYRALYNRVSIDCVIGASAGSLNAWCIACGMTPDQLDQLWLDAGESAALKLRLPTSITGSIFNTDALEERIRELVRLCRPKMEIGVVVSRPPSLVQHLICDGDIDADVLLASCAVPFLLPAKRINGTLYVDGGLRDACPDWIAHQLGATEILSVNVWNPDPHAPEKPGLIRIDPPAPLGPIRTSMVWNRERILHWIDLGRRTAEVRLARK